MQLIGTDERIADAFKCEEYITIDNIKKEHRAKKKKVFFISRYV